MGAMGVLSNAGYRAPMDRLAGATRRVLETLGSSAWRERAASLAMGRLKSLRAQKGSSSGCACKCAHAVHHRLP